MSHGVSILAAAMITAASSVVAIVAQVTDSPNGVFWAQAASTGAAITALAYIARQFAAGRLVARDPAASEVALREATEKLTQLVDASNAREERLWKYVTRGERDN